MKLVIGADHKGYSLATELTKSLQAKGVDVEHLGQELHQEGDDYVDFAKIVGEYVRSNAEVRGIVICGSGVGVDIAANKINGIRCALGYSPKQVASARNDDDVNVLALGSEYTPLDQAESLVDAFMSTPFAGEERFEKRLEKLRQLEQ